MIEADQLYKCYRMRKNTIEVLSGATLRVERGETVAVTGRSGAGKSTLLHILGGLDRPDSRSGVVRISGHEIFALSAARRTDLRARQIGFIFQSYHLIHEMDVLDNVMLPARALGHSRMTMRKRAHAMLDAVGLGDRVGHTPVELSGGEQQRVAIARALMNEPSVVFADEPTGNLDEETGQAILSLLFGLVREQQLSLLLVTHNDAIATSCDRHLHLEDGVLHSVAPVPPIS